jgi:hypothetical protein
VFQVFLFVSLDLSVFSLSLCCLPAAMYIRTARFPLSGSLGVLRDRVDNQRSFLSTRLGRGAVLWAAFGNPPEEAGICMLEAISCMFGRKG